MSNREQREREHAEWIACWISLMVLGLVIVALASLTCCAPPARIQYVPRSDKTCVPSRPPPVMPMGPETCHDGAGCWNASLEVLVGYYADEADEWMAEAARCRDIVHAKAKAKAKP